MFEHAFEALVHSGFRGASGPNALLLVCAKCHVGDASYTVHPSHGLDWRDDAMILIAVECRYTFVCRRRLQQTNGKGGKHGRHGTSISHIVVGVRA